MTDQRNAVLEYARTHHADFLKNLNSLVSIPSVSTSPEHRSDIDRAAEQVSGLFKQIGLEHTQILPTAGHPVVYADWLHAGLNKPIVLIYGHYDVQPADPLDQWETGPFEPSIRGEYLFGRGASDMKGQVIAVLAALQSIFDLDRRYPVNIKFMIEGEEEIGSPNLKEFIKANQALLACDVSLNPDAGMIAQDVPTIVYSLRGLAFFELRIYGPDHDLHSGVFGGIVHNPAKALAEIIAGFHNENGTVTLPGFYDKVRPLSPEEHSELARLPMNDTSYIEQTGVRQLWGEKEFTPTERIGRRPTLEVNGLYSGFIGEGTKTVIPAYAMAKISTRLVADQDPEEVHRLLRTYLEKNIPSTVRWELIYFGGGQACATDPNHPAAVSLTKALEAVWHVRPVLKPEGGSVPVVGDIQKLLGADTVLTGFGLPDDRIHSPNERLHLPTWYKGIEALVHFFYNMSEQEKI
jgi:acetylornithine deacetylase/succinyl-diaminopimelate desuccinylase-like protein